MAAGTPPQKHLPQFHASWATSHSPSPLPLASACPIPPAPTEPSLPASTLTEGAGLGPANVAPLVPAADLGQARAAASSKCQAGSSCAALEWAEWRTSPQSWGAPQANQERLSRYKASQSGGSAPFPHSLPSQIVTMGTITKKTAPKCNHFPVNFYPSAPLSPSASMPSSP